MCHNPFECLLSALGARHTLPSDNVSCSPVLFRPSHGARTKF